MKISNVSYNYNYILVANRYYNPHISQFYATDPLAEKYYFQSPYTYATDNPVGLVDVDGLGTNENEWKPIVKDDGSVSYSAEKGDSASTLAKQYSISQTQAEQITGTNGDEKIKEGTEINGLRVKYITGNEVLKLNLSTADDQHVFDQFNFAMVHSEKSGKTGFFTTDYYSKVFDQLSQIRDVDISVGHIKFKLELPLYETQNTFSFHPKYFPYFISNSPSETVSSNKGDMFGKYEYIKEHRYDIYLTFGKQPTVDNLKYQGYVPVYYKIPERHNYFKDK